MSGFNGRDLIIKIGGTAVASVQSKTITHGKEAVDVTTDDDGGWRRLLPVAGTRSVDVPVEGVCDEVNLPQLQNLWANDAFADVTIEYPDGSTGEAEDGFFLNGFEISGSSEAHVAFTATLQSSGEVTITAAP